MLDDLLPALASAFDSPLIHFRGERFATAFGFREEPQRVKNQVQLRARAHDELAAHVGIAVAIELVGSGKPYRAAFGANVHPLCVNQFGRFHQADHEKGTIKVTVAGGWQ